MSSERLSVAIDEKLAILHATDAQDRRSAVAAAAVLPLIVDHLRLGEFRGHVALDRKPRFLLRFQVSSLDGYHDLDGDVLLKVYGDRPRGEGPLLSIWRSRGILVPPTRSGELGGCSWLKMRFLNLTPVALADKGQALATTDELAASSRVMHQRVQGLEPLLRRVEDLIVPRWDQAVATLQTGGYRVPDSWRAKIVRAYGAAPLVPLHGDLGTPNIARNDNGRLVIFDPSALLGPAEFDAVRWAARLSGLSLTPHEVLDAWREHENVATETRANDLLAAECVLEAGAAVSTNLAQPGNARASTLLSFAEEMLA